MERPIFPAGRMKAALIFMISGIVLSLLMASCATMLTSYAGKKIRPGYEIPVPQAENHPGFFNSDDISVNYVYWRAGGEMRIKGAIRFADHLQSNFPIISYFNLGLLLADSQGNILGNVALAPTSYRNTEDLVRFEKSITLPPGTELMAFTYTGKAIEGGFSAKDQSGGGDIEFFHYPVVK